MTYVTAAADRLTDRNAFSVFFHFFFHPWLITHNPLLYPTFHGSELEAYIEDRKGGTDRRTGGQTDGRTDGPDLHHIG